MPKPPKVTRFHLDRGGRQTSNKAKPEGSPLKQKILEVMQNANELPTLDLENKLQETTNVLGLFDRFVEAFKLAYSTYQLDSPLDTKHLVNGLQKRLQLNFNTRRGMVRSLVVDHGSTLSVSISSSILGNKQSMNEVETEMRQHYHKIKNIQIENVKLVGSTLNLSFQVKKDQNILEDLILLLKPFV